MAQESADEVSKDSNRHHKARECWECRPIVQEVAIERFEGVVDKEVQFVVVLRIHSEVG
jgi:hypothetical protein